MVGAEGAGKSRRMSVPARLAELAGLRAFVRETSAQLGAQQEAISDVVQAVDECVTNSIVHGYRGKDGRVQVELEREGRDLVVRLTDQAPPFDPTSVPSPDTNQPLELRRPGGMGVHLARELMDQMTYRQTEQGNELTMTKGCLAAEEERDAEHRA